MKVARASVSSNSIFSISSIGKTFSRYCRSVYRTVSLPKQISPSKLEAQETHIFTLIVKKSINFICPVLQAQVHILFEVSLLPYQNSYKG